VVHGDADFGREVLAVTEAGAYGQSWRPALAEEILAMRKRLEASRGARDLKRGPGGLVDVEFLVQLFQLKYGGGIAALRTPNTWKALEALGEAGLLSEQEYSALRRGYDFLLRVQSRLRIVHNRSLDEVPQAAEEVEKLARRLGFEGTGLDTAGGQFLVELDRHTRQVRETFLRLLARERDR
jgi:glutamate-ammonia-ligase adenylyltransferase